MKLATNVIGQEKLKDVLITRTAIKTLKPEQWVEKVVNFQFKDATQATKINTEVEISGFGKFYISASKLKRKLRIMNRSIEKLDIQLQDTSLPESKIKSLQKRRADAIEVIGFLKTRGI